MSVDIDRKAFRDLSYGIYVVSSHHEGKLNAQIVNTVVQVTSEPPRVAVIINRDNLTYEYISKNNVFGISILDQSAPIKFFGPFGFRSGRDVDKLVGVQYKTGVTGCPLVTDYALSVFEVEVFEKIGLGTHGVFIGDVVHSEVLKPGTPLTYQYYQKELKGKPSPASPSFSTVI